MRSPDVYSAPRVALLCRPGRPGRGDSGRPDASPKLLLVVPLAFDDKSLSLDAVGDMPGGGGGDPS